MATWGDGRGRVGRWCSGALLFEVGGKQTAEHLFAKADDEDQIESGDDKVVGCDVKVCGVVHAHPLGYGAHVGDAAGIDAYGNGTDFCKLCGVGVVAEKEEPCHRDHQNGPKPAEECLEGVVERHPREAA